MKIWLDADASPRPVKETLYRAVQRVELHLTVVSNHAFEIPRSPFIERLLVASGFDEADNEIVARCEQGDIVITNDIPLSAEAIEEGAMVLNFRGEKLTKANISARLSMRNFMDELRSSGVDTGGPKAFSAADTREFANSLDRELSAALRRNKK